MTTPPPIPDLEAIRGRAEAQAVRLRRLADANRHFALPDVAAFFDADADALDALLSRCEELEGVLGDAESLLFAVAECVDLHPKIREQIAAFQERARSTLQRGGG